MTGEETNKEQELKSEGDIVSTMVMNAYEKEGNR
jgi:hypothetical protein